MKHFGLRILALVATLAAAAFPLSGCGAQRSEESSSAPESAVAVHSGEAGLCGSYQEDDYQTEIPEAAVKIILSGETARVEGNGASVSGGVVTVRDAGAYLVSGTLGDGQIVVEAAKGDTVRLILQNASITNSTGAAIDVKQCDKLILTLAGGSENLLADGESYTLSAGEDEPDAALFSKEDLTINGGGSLCVSANHRNGIASKDDLVILGGTISVTAVNDALRGRDSVSILGGSLTLTAGNDGIKSNNDEESDKGWIAIDGGAFTIDAGHDGIQAETALTVGDGVFTITTGGGSVNTSAGDARPEGFGAKHPAGHREGLSDGRTSPDGAAFGEQGAAPPEPPEEMPQASGDMSGNPMPRPPAVHDAESSEEDSSESFKGFKSGTALTVRGGSFTLDCLDDAFHSNGSLTVEDGYFTIATDDDGFHADQTTTINQGTIEILRCYEGIEGGDVVINGGEIRLTARDDGVNSAGGSDGTQSFDRFSRTGGSNITVNGGLLVVSASGDGLDANGEIIQTGGTVLSNGPVSGGDGALDYDGGYRISGGILAAAGSAGMAQSVSDNSEQPALFVKFTSVQQAGTAISLSDAQGGMLLSFAPAKAFETIVLSAPELTIGESYTLSANPEGSGGADGLSDSTAAPGDALCTVTLSSASTAINSDGSAAGTGGMGRGGEPGRMTREPGTREKNSESSAA